MFFSFSGISVMRHSVVSSRPAMDAAFCSAVRVTLVGIDDAGLDEVFVVVGGHVVAVVALAAS